MFLRVSWTNLLSQYWGKLGQQPILKPTTARRTGSDHLWFSLEPEVRTILTWVTERWGGSGRVGRREGWGSRRLSPSDRPEVDGGGRGGEMTTNGIFSELQAASPARTHPLRQGSNLFQSDEKTLWQHGELRVLLRMLHHSAMRILTEALFGCYVDSRWIFLRILKTLIQSQWHDGKGGNFRSGRLTGWGHWEPRESFQCREASILRCESHLRCHCWPTPRYNTGRKLKWDPWRNISIFSSPDSWTLIGFLALLK